MRLPARRLTLFPSSQAVDDGGAAESFSVQHNPTTSSHQNERDANHVQDIYPQQITPRRPTPGDANSCKRKSKPSPKISAPRRMVVQAIWLGCNPFCRSLLTTNASETPARKRKAERVKFRPIATRQKTFPDAHDCSARIVAVGLKHQHAGQATHPVNVGQAR